MDKSSTTKQSLVMLHGWCGSADDFAPQKQYFQDQYDVLIPNWMDLIAGNILNDENIFEKAAETLSEWIQSQTNQSPILIGHSLGGILALHLAVNYNVKTNGIIVLDSSLPLSVDRIAAYKSLAQKLMRKLDKKIVLDVINEYYVSKYDNLKIMQPVVEGMLQRVNFNWARMMDHAADVDTVQLLQSYKAPLLYIGSSQPLGDFHLIQKYMSHAMFAQVVCSGHFIQLNAAKQVNAMLAQIIMR